LKVSTNVKIGIIFFENFEGQMPPLVRTVSEVLTKNFPAEPKPGMCQLCFM